MGKSDSNGVSRDPEVLLRPTRRVFGKADKLRILTEVDQARSTGGKVNEILRREGIYSSQLTDWRRKFFGNGQSTPDCAQAMKRSGGAAEIRRLAAENARLREELRQAKLVIGIQKKVAALMDPPQVEGEKSEQR